MNIRLKRFESHTLFWIALILSFSLVYGLEEGSETVLILAADHLMSLPFYMAAAYGIAYAMLPRLAAKRIPIYLIPLFFLLIGVLAFAELLKTNFVSMPLLFPDKQQIFGFNMYDLSRAAFYILLPSIFFVSMKYLKSWYSINIQKKELESENLKNELQILKAQINPEFVLNILEHLKNRAAIDPKEAAKGIEQVSELLSFILYESNQPRIELEKEIQLIEVLISLQEMKRKRDMDFRFSRIGAMGGIKIVPMTFFTLVEYLFKNLDDEKECSVRLYLEVQGRNVDFWVESADCLPMLKGLENDNTILNLKQRLKLAYNKEYSFEYKQVLNVHKLHLNFNAGE